MFFKSKCSLIIRYFRFGNRNVFSRQGGFIYHNITCYERTITIHLLSFLNYKYVTRNQF